MKVSVFIGKCFVAFLLLMLGWKGLMAGFYLIGDVKRVRIPVEVQNNVILLPVRINGSFEMNFILDTGVKSTILTEPVILPWLDVDTLKDINVRGLGKGEIIKASLARDISMSLPGVEGSGLNLVVMPDGLISYSGMFGKPVYGIIGYDLFGQFTIEINYQQEYIVLHNPFKFKGKKGGRWQTIPLDIRKSKPYIQATLKDHTGKSIEETWLLDTGASMAISLFQDNVDIPEKSINSFLGKGLSGEVHGYLGRNPAFTIGRFTLDDIITGYPDEESLAMFPESMDWYGNIGSDVLSRFKIIFDYLHEKVYLRKNGTFNNAFDYNNAGLEFISLGADYDNFLVTYVRPDSPADKAGIQKNDLVLTLNGTTVKNMDIEELYGGLIKKKGKLVRMKVQRNGEVIKTEFMLEEEI